MSSLTLAAYKIFIEAVDRFEEKNSNMKIAENFLKIHEGGTIRVLSFLNLCGFSQAQGGTELDGGRGGGWTAPHYTSGP